MTVARRSTHTTVKVSYVTSLELVPGFKRPWPLSFTVDVLTLNTPKADSTPK